MASSCSQPTQASGRKFRGRPLVQNPPGDKPTQASDGKRKGSIPAQGLADEKPTTASIDRAWQIWRLNVLGPRGITFGPGKTCIAFDHFGYDQQNFLYWMSTHSFEAGEGNV
jgi:hypothetical protein